MVTIQNIQDLIDKAQEEFRANNCPCYEIYPKADLPVIAVEITWGDWKHDHGFVDYKMKELGALKLGEETTEENGSDTYSSIHYFIVPPTFSK